jgi:serine-type D-Ala-D-Ala endopeptidase (penicillin-binding protein 7)
MGEISMKFTSRKTILRITMITIVGLAIAFIIGRNLVLTNIGAAPMPAEKAKATFNFILPDSNVLAGIKLNLKSGIVIDNETHKVLFCYNADKAMPVASISKLLTAMVVLDNYRPDSIITITAEDCTNSSRSMLRAGNQMTVQDLLHMALIRSDNRAARAISRSVCGSVEAFAAKMNDKAREIGLENTVMYEPTGLDERNTSTAADCARLINHAALYPEVTRITGLKEYSVRIINKKKIRKIYNTNKLLFSKYHVLAGKTGYISESAYCLTTIVEDEKGRKLTVVVLGASGPQTRFREARRLAAWAFKKLSTT